MIQEENINRILKQSLKNGFTILLLIGLVLFLVYSILNFQNDIYQFFIIIFQTIVQIHPYIFMMLGCLFCGIFAFVSSFLLKTINKNFVNQQTKTVFKTVAFFCCTYNVLITGLVFIHMFFFISQNDNLTVVFSDLFISNSILCLSNILLSIFFVIYYIINKQNQNSSGNAIVNYEYSIEELLILAMS